MNTTVMDSKDTPKLLKARRRHTKYSALALAPLLLFTAPALPFNLQVLMQLVGYALIIVCVLGRGYCSLFIGGRKNDELIADGPFAIVRNPLYVFSFLGTIGIGLQSGSLLITALLIGAFCFYYPKVVEKEEAFLLHKFGAPYANYMNSVPRWWPNFKQWAEPETVVSKPGFVRKTLLDASVFFAALPIFTLLNWLRASGALPVIFLLP